MGKWSPIYPSHSLIFNSMSTSLVTQHLFLTNKLTGQGRTFNMKRLGIPSHMFQAMGASGFESMELFHPKSGRIEDRRVSARQEDVELSHMLLFKLAPGSVSVLTIFHAAEFLQGLVCDC